MYHTLGACAVILITGILWLYIHVTRNFNFWKKSGLPYVKPIPLFGNAFKLVTLEYSIGGLVKEVHNSMKTPYVGFFVFDQPFLLLRDPEIIKQVLIKDFEHFEDRSLIENRAHDFLASNILFIIKNPTWKSIRSKLTPVFTSGKMKAMLPLIIEASNDMNNYIRHQAEFSNETEAREVAMKYTTDVISSCAFGINAHCFHNEDAEFRVASRRVFDWKIVRAVSMSSYFLAPFLARLFRLKFIDPTAGNFLRKVFWKHMNERESLKSSRGDLIDILIALRKSPGSNNLDDELILAQAVQFFIAGFETTGTTITFTLYYLAVNPKVQNKLHDEIVGILERYGDLSYEALQEMKYLDMVLSEILRMCPALPYLDRRCTKPYQLPGTDVVLPKGIPIYVSLFGLHFDPEYFPDPLKFDPERFSEENNANIPNGAYLPFGDGPRNCIGSRFAVLAFKVAVVRIVSEFEIGKCPLTPKTLKLEPKSFMLAPADGKLYLNFMKR